MSLKAFSPAILWLLTTASIYSSCADRGGADVRQGATVSESASVGEAGREGPQDVSSSNAGTTVYLCEGPMSHVYHYSQTCRGLRRCSTRLHKMTLEEAVKLGRRVCGWEKND